MCSNLYPYIYTYFNALNSKGLNSLSSFVVVSPALFSCSRIFFSTPVVRIGIRLGVLTGESDGGGVILLNWLCTEQKKILCSYIFNLDFAIVCQNIFYSASMFIRIWQVFFWIFLFKF